MVGATWDEQREVGSTSAMRSVGKAGRAIGDIDLWQEEEKEEEEEQEEEEEDKWTHKERSGCGSTCSLLSLHSKIPPDELMISISPSP